MSFIAIELASQCSGSAVAQRQRRCDAKASFHINEELAFLGLLLPACCEQLCSESCSARCDDGQAAPVCQASAASRGRSVNVTLFLLPFRPICGT